MSDTPPTEREALRQWMIDRCEARIANGRRMASEAHKEQNWQDAALARHSIGQSERFLERLRNDA